MTNRISTRLTFVKTFLILACVLTMPAVAFGQPDTGAGLSAAELELASTVSERIATSEWLGPLAPIALSPFFGMACLAGIAQFGPESLVASNGFLSADSPLHNPVIFWTFAVLATLTSLPRFTKISKPIAGALEQVESYSSIIALVAIRYLAGNDTPVSPEDETVMVSTVVYTAGIGQVSIDAALAIAAGVNIIVINAVKFFFEFLVWLVPVPFLDACFEVANKACVAGLMAIYSFSPLIATGVNITLFVICGVLFLWTRRQVVFIRTMLVGWLLSWFKTGHPPVNPEFVVFPKENFGPFAARERVSLKRTSDGFILSKRTLFGSIVNHPVMASRTARIQPGWITHSVIMSDDEGMCELLMSRHKSHHLDVVAALLRIDLVEEDPESPRKAACDELGPFTPKPKVV